MRFLTGIVKKSLPLILATAAAVRAQEVTMTAGPSRQVGKYLVSLRVPEGGLTSGEEQQLEFRLVDTSREDPVLGPTAVIRATVLSTVSMPAMPSMAKVEEIAHPEGIPGDYGLHPSFAHGGDFLLTLRITPPKDEPFSVEFPLKVGDEPANRTPRPRPYQAQLKTEPAKVKAGETTNLQISILSNLESRDPSGRPSGKRQLLKVRTFDTIHERQLHLIIVRRDLSYFTHQHPELKPDGTFVLEGFVFPSAGDYQLFFDTAPKGAGGQVLLASLKVEGKGAPPVQSSTQSTARSQHIGDVIVTLKDPNALVPRRTLQFGVTLEGPAGPLSDLEPYLGAMGHMILIHEDAQTFVHSHPDERDPENGRKGDLTFLVRPPKPGRYRVWVEFKRAGTVNIAEFPVEVKDVSQEAK